MSSTSSAPLPPQPQNWHVYDPSCVSPPPSFPPSRPWSPASYASALSLYDRLTSPSVPAPLRSQVVSSLAVLSDALRLYGPDSVWSSYNGGKDASVLLHLQIAAHANHFRTLQQQRQQLQASSKTSDSAASSLQTCSPLAPRCLYFSTSSPPDFPSVLSLLHRTSSCYDLSMTVFHNVDFKLGLTALVYDANPLDASAPARGLDPPPRHLAFVLGTRSTDPNAAGQGVFSPSSSWLPPFLRVNPVLDWSYGQVWEFLRGFELPYCDLYDEGYTSLGRVGDTERNPELKREDGTYEAAWKLKDETKERDGRKDKKK